MGQQHGHQCCFGLDNGDSGSSDGWRRESLFLNEVLGSSGIILMEGISYTSDS